jgi:hypothetical protein
LSSKRVLERENERTSFNTSTSISGSSVSFLNFINAIRSPATQVGYRNSLRRYMKHLKVVNTDDLLIHQSDPKKIQSQIIDYIMSLRNDGISYSTIKFLVAPVFTFYQLNDVLINRKRVMRYLGEYRKVVKDKAYTTEQIQTALQNADQRMRCIILLLASWLPYLRLN